MSGSWRPLFSGDSAAQMLAIVEDIADATAGGAFDADHLDPAADPTWQHSLEGLAGQSLLHAYLALHGASESRADTAIALLDRATDAAGALSLPPSLYFGFPGISWVAAHLTGRLFEEEQDNCREVDDALLRALENPSWHVKYELLEGVVGIGVYALERLPRPSAVRLVEAVVARLAACAERTTAGAAFFSPYEALSPAYREAAPRGLYNLGMAHGVAGVIAFLGSVCRAGIATEQVRPLLADTVAWLLTRERPAESDYRFANLYIPTQDIDFSRLGWCHGDLSVATALLVAARGAGEQSWDHHARKVALAAAARTTDSTPLPDASLCHGAAGIGHIFNRLYQETGEEPLAQAARSCFQRAIAMREPGTGIGGYRILQRGKKYNNPGFRIGSSGVGLAILAAISPIHPDWDHLLMAS
jgi:lantibiotic modifying enzyme